MAKKALAAQVLADNLGKLMELKKVDSGPKLAKLSKVSQKSISNMLSSRHDPYLSTIEKVAGALGIQPHQLLCPVADNDFLAVCLAWAQSDERGPRGPPRNCGGDPQQTKPWKRPGGRQYPIY